MPVPVSVRPPHAPLPARALRGIPGGGRKGSIDNCSRIRSISSPSSIEPVDQSAPHWRGPPCPDCGRTAPSARPPVSRRAAISAARYSASVSVRRSSRRARRSALAIAPPEMGWACVNRGQERGAESSCPSECTAYRYRAGHRVSAPGSPLHAFRAFVLLLVLRVSGQRPRPPIPITGDMGFAGWQGRRHDRRRCGKALCGPITRLTEKARVEGPTTDSNNPDPALVPARWSACGAVRCITQSDGKWQGKIYYPFRVRTYRAYISRNPSRA